MFQVRTFEVVIEVVGGPPAGSGGGVGSELVVSIAILFNGWTRLMSRLDSEFITLGSLRAVLEDKWGQISTPKAFASRLFDIRLLRREASSFVSQNRERGYGMNRIVNG